MTRIAPIAATAALLLTLSACGMERKQPAHSQPAPEKFSGQVAAKYSKLVPLVSGERCEVGSFSIDGPNGEVWELCVSASEYDSVKVGDVFAR